MMCQQQCESLNKFSPALSVPKIRLCNFKYQNWNEIRESIQNVWKNSFIKTLAHRALYSFFTYFIRFSLSTFQDIMFPIHSIDLSDEVNSIIQSFYPSYCLAVEIFFCLGKSFFAIFFLLTQFKNNITIHLPITKNNSEKITFESKRQFLVDLWEDWYVKKSGNSRSKKNKRKEVKLSDRHR